jgi:tetrapyrrole methylase family protein/MazG family protein
LGFDERKITMNFNELPQIIKSLGLSKTNQLTLVSAKEMAHRYYPPFAPDQDVLISDFTNSAVAQKVGALLLLIYPANHHCKVAKINIKKEWGIIETTIGEVSSQINTILYIPPYLENCSLETFEDLVAHLRAPEGCPWDREQTHLSLRPNLLEETYEVLKALDAGTTAGLQEELGDLLLQIVLHAQISNEAGEFNLSDVVAGIHHKIVHRHPHVFGDVKVEGSQGVIRNWEVIKAGEREENGKETNQSILGGVPKAMPALSLAQEYQKRAARVGFDWPEIKPVLAKVNEELDELKAANSKERKADELGDLLFAVVNLVRWYDLDAESTLREMTNRFYNRFTYVEKKARDEGRRLQDMKLEEMDAWWEEAKAKGL